MDAVQVEGAAGTVSLLPERWSVVAEAAAMADLAVPALVGLLAVARAGGVEVGLEQARVLRSEAARLLESLLARPGIVDDLVAATPGPPRDAPALRGALLVDLTRVRDVCAGAFRVSTVPSVVRCRQCGAALTLPVRWAPAGKVEDQMPPHPRGVFGRVEDHGEYGPARLGEFIVHPEDLAPGVRGPSGPFGCCGFDGTADEHHLACPEGHPVAHGYADCWMPHCYGFDPVLTWRDAAPSGGAAV